MRILIALLSTGGNPGARSCINSCAVPRAAARCIGQSCHWIWSQPAGFEGRRTVWLNWVQQSCRHATSWEGSTRSQVQLWINLPEDLFDKCESVHTLGSHKGGNETPLTCPVVCPTLSDPVKVKMVWRSCKALGIHAYSALWLSYFAAVQKQQACVGTIWESGRINDSPGEFGDASTNKYLAIDGSPVLAKSGAWMLNECLTVGKHGSWLYLVNDG